MASTRKVTKKASVKRNAAKAKKPGAAGRKGDVRAALRHTVKLARMLETMGKDALASGKREDLQELVECLTLFRKRITPLPRIITPTKDARRMLAEAFAAGWRLDDDPKAN